MSCGRYAPSPTGALHLGNLRTALLAWLQVRLDQGVFIMRIDDLDGPRNKSGALQQNLADLIWLGLDWDEGPEMGGPNAPYLQSQRTAVYSAAFEALNDSDWLFPCSCSRKDIAQALSAPHESGIGGIYPGTCRDLDPGVISDDCHSQAFAWRFRTHGLQIEFDDQLMGKQRQNLETQVGDFVVKRKDSLFAYQLASIIDDHAMGITDVLRADDLLHSTPRQIALLRALDADIPRFWHVPLVYDHDGERMSKRFGSESAQQWRETGKTAPHLVGQFAFELGFIDAPRSLSARELLQSLTTERFRSALMRNGVA